MKLIIAILFIPILIGCQNDRIDISQLTPQDQILFTIAAEREGVEVTLNGILGDWIIEYNPNLDVRGRASTMGNFCRISINPIKINATPCTLGGTDQRFIVVSRHELRHCEGFRGHISDPEKLMYRTAPCWPVD